MTPKCPLPDQNTLAADHSILLLLRATAMLWQPPQRRPARTGCRIHHQNGDWAACLLLQTRVLLLDTAPVLPIAGRRPDKSGIIHPNSPSPTVGGGFLFGACLNRDSNRRFTVVDPGGTDIMIPFCLSHASSEALA